MFPRPTLVAILNASPDSFAGDAPATLEQAQAAIRAGAHILDIGGESTRPGATPVDPKAEQARILPLIRALAGTVPISVDTRHASTMEAALDAGATIVNDVSALTHDPAAAALLASRTCQVILMHSRGTPQTMQSLARYTDVVAEVKAELAQRIEAATRAGIARHRLIIDPGLGFAKTPAHNITILQRLREFESLNLPILIGASRKSFIGHYGHEPNPAARTPGSIAAALFALEQGAILLRVHDIAETAQAVRLWQTLNRRPPP